MCGNVKNRFMIFTFSIIVSCSEYHLWAQRMIPHRFMTTCSLPLLELRSNQGVELTWRKQAGASDSKSRRYSSLISKSRKHI
jgi:hypothetical protein